MKFEEAYVSNTYLIFLYFHQYSLGFNALRDKPNQRSSYDLF